MATPLDSLGIVHETDVLILGAGASGCGAALSASRHGLRVLLADKGKLESCGSLGGGNDHFMAVLNTDAPGDTTETIVDFYCTPTSGYSPSQVRQWVEAMPQMIEVLKSLGIEFLHNADGSFYRTTGFGQPGSWWTHINNGKYIKRRLAGLIRSQGVDVLEYVQCTKILVQDGKAIGAAGFHVLDGTFHIIRAKIVISALGRLNGRVSVNSSLNPFNSAFSPFITGSQIALPYEAGAQIITLDTEQEATLLPKGWGCPGMNGITSSGAKGINALGQRYMGKYHPMMEIGPRYLLIQGTHRELTEGNGPPFVLDLTHIDRDILHHLQYDSMPGDKETWNDYCAQAGIDFSAKPMEVELSELYINGILYLKDNFETRTVKGLFGGSVFNDFSGSICSGYIAGDHAARAAGSTYTELPEPDADELGREKRRVFKPLGVSDGIRQDKFEAAVRQVMDYYMGYVRNEKGMSTALEKFALIESVEDTIMAKKPARAFARARGHAPSADVPAHHAGHAGTPGDRAFRLPAHGLSRHGSLAQQIACSGKGCLRPQGFLGRGPASLTGNPPGSAPAPGAARFPPQRGHQRLQRRQNPSFETRSLECLQSLAEKHPAFPYRTPATPDRAGRPPVNAAARRGTSFRKWNGPLRTATRPSRWNTCAPAIRFPA